MNTNSNLKAALFGGALMAAIASYANAGQPTDVVSSDPSGNTAMGQLALALLETPNCGSLVACYNTAAGAGSLYANSSGTANAAYGFQTLNSNGNGNYNTASGYRALLKNTSGGNNTGVGAQALYSNQSGSYNTAVGTDAMFYGTGSYNTATGFSALKTNVNGTQNSAFGESAMGIGTNGSFNTALGYATLSENTGNYNTAVGDSALTKNASGGSYNTATGGASLLFNSSGNNNSAFGYDSLYSNQSGAANVAVGLNALYSNVGGAGNIAIGAQAGYVITGSNNIDIGSEGNAGENGVIRIGQAPENTAVYVTGIATTKLTGSAVYVTSSGQLGVAASSERYKNRIASMGDRTDKMQRLRPVTFHLKSEPKGVVQYGLIAEEVVKVYPELVIRDDAGVIQGVRYDELAPMLLNEVQKQQSRITAQEHHLASQEERMVAQAAKVEAQDRKIAKLEQMNESLQASIVDLIGPGHRVAMQN